MRDLKFRVWDNENKRLVSLGVPYEEGFIGIDEIGRIMPADDQKRSRFVSMQYTGLLDRHGKEIFEGDIVKWDDCSSKYGDKAWWRVAVVRYVPGYWEFHLLPQHCINCFQGHKEAEYNDFKGGSFMYTSDTTAGGNIMLVIGNGFENPELLES